MKKIVYKILQRMEEDGTPVTGTARMDYSAANLAAAQKVAYDGVTIEDDGLPEPEPAPEAVTWDELAAAIAEGVNAV